MLIREGLVGQGDSGEGENWCLSFLTLKRYKDESEKSSADGTLELCFCHCLISNMWGRGL